MLLGALVTSLLVLAAPHLAAARPDPPVINGDTATCTGDQHLGIASGIDFLTPPILNLYVNSLTTDITPGDGVAGISMQHQGANGSNGSSWPVKGDAGGPGDPGQNLTVNYDGGSQAIITQGSNATGILVGSTGGNGGKGGGGYAVIVTPGLGGNGGDGAAGGTVTLTSNGLITTSGSQANGILAVSQGGDGGQGGLGEGATGLGGGIGGHGGAGGSSGVVTVNSSSGITTQGEKANGIFAVSSGGNGGTGGAGYGDYGIGGNGGAGGNSGNVTLTNTGGIATNGDYANGLFALSQAGNGGDGGEAAGIYGQGGDGGVGGTAGVVIVTSHGNITTSGTQAQGIRAQSLGGAGGDGGYGGGIIGHGGAALGSGPGGQVEVNNTGIIETFGEESRGIFAQSVGGFAGSSGGAGGLFAFGASGESAGSGGGVTITNSGAILTHGAYADAISAQSIGGGGGTGGGGEGLVNLGGSGSAGGDGGVVTVNNSGDLQVSGASSRGIFAQSVGGGGGDGGKSVGLVSIGGSGSSTSHGSSVNVTNSGAITSTASAIYAESVGGGGGSGGASVGLVSLGGSGGGGGDGGTVAVTNSGVLSTSEVNASGIFAQSVGGGGGNGGGAVALGLTASVAIGGSADQGGAGDTVTVINNAGGNIITAGDSSHGILAQSVGGGGGQGGYAVSVTAAEVAASTSVAIGGSGGGGGNANTVMVENYADITTQGSDAHGIFAQSVGGGGGGGGYSFADTSGLLGNGYQIAVAVGGSGGAGGNGGAVSVVSDGGDLFTTGYRAYGILAQSVGGGGGDGGFSIASNTSVAGNLSCNVAVGGSGGSGGAGDAVSVTNGSNITTQGVYASGLVAQSIGGGGGNGGTSVSAAISMGDVGVSVGGSGGSGGSGGQVSVSNAGTISTAGDAAVGILAQSVGGGGGNGGLSVAGAIASISPTVSLGGTGGVGGVGNEVTVSNSGQISTQGKNAQGILAQSVGGGGGNGGLSVSGNGGIISYAISVGGVGGTGASGNNVTVNNTNNISTTGNDSQGILAQSIGGGGGNGNGSVSGSLDIAGGVSISLGGSGGSGGDGKDVNVNTAGTISTSGINAAGVLAQSVGGGGGNGGFSVAANGSIVASESISLGGLGNTGGSGGNINLVSSSSSIFTQGANSDGINAQSVGGGGGNGGFSVAGSITMGVIPDIPASASVAVSLGGRGGAGGIGGQVHLTSNGAQIATVGDGSRGIFAQSLGGGGGTGGWSAAVSMAVAAEYPMTIALSVGGNGGTGNTAGLVEVNSSSNISTQGQNAQGIFAQSVGGGGGTGGISGTLLVNLSAAGTTSFGASLSIGGNGEQGGDSLNDPTTGYAVKVNSTGSLITTSGSHSTGILAQSIGGGGGHGGISLNISGGGAINLADVPLLNLGCKAGGGGNAGAVLVENSSSIYTMGDYASGILAQSAGGGGGTGGTEIKCSASISWGSTGVSGGLSLGASGESGAGGGNADAVTVIESLAPGETNKIIATQGLNSAGIMAQSIGGGGGNGGFSLSGSLGLSTFQILPTFDYTAGASGGAGGSAGAVSVTSVSTIQTLGENSQGILAQSLGGGGGNGGVDIALSGDIANTLISGFHVAMGGDGGSGGNGANVTVNSTGEMILTAGNSSAGILAQSVGGGGGNGGGSISLGIGLEAAAVAPISLSIGGKGGSGGTAGDVTVTSSSSIYTGAYDPETGAFTSGNDSQGILAQSIGGGGGNGGYSLRGRVDSSTAMWGTSLSFGGEGGAGNTAGAVNVTSTGAFISTMGDRSQGILAQSVGGGGGNGGFSVAGGVSNGMELAISSGGNGGSGANAGTVSVTNSSNIFTGYVDADGNVYGHDSAGILAQSLGGGGGNGGFSVSGSVGLISAPSISLGGTGGVGGDGAGVTINNTGAGIITWGDRAAGISGQSIGGGGGNAGFSVAGSLSGGLLNLAMTCGSNGGAGGNAGAVMINNGPDSIILTIGNDSQGILAQSLGGGGGNAAFSVAGDLTLGLGLELGIGSNGGSGGNGSAVTVTDTGAYIVTYGDRAAGIQAQSLGGGGGSGGFIVGGGLSAAGAFNLSFGGAAGSNGAGGTVAVTTSNSIYTYGNDSAAVLAQSLGGGGGVGGINVGGDLTGATSVNLTLGASGASGDGSEVTITATGDNITTVGDRSSGILAQSIGGGGGVGWVGVSGAVQADSATLTIGGQSGASGNGGQVTVQNSSDMLIVGTGSYGILAQSIGGGGGVGSNAALASASGVTLGGGTNVSGDGGAVSVTNAGWISTEAVGSYGIVAQSIGGGGGLASYTGAGTSSGLLNASMPQGDGTNSGNGNAVSVTNSGIISTTGYGAAGIVAQSIGGGGGLNVANGNAGSAGGLGSGGAITVANSGIINTTGDYAHGIVAQSVGGQGTGGDVNITVDGAVQVQGQGANGIFAQSKGGAGNGNISVTIGETGLVYCGSTSGTAVSFVDGQDNLLQNYGVIEAANVAVSSTDGSNTTINNYGGMYCSINLGQGTNAFNNLGTFWSGAVVNLGAGNTLTNSGNMEIGAPNLVAASALTGNFVQTGSGILHIDLDYQTNTADRLSATGTAKVDGKVGLTNLNPGFMKPGFQQETIVSAAGGLEFTGQSQVFNSVVMQSQLLVLNSTDLVLSSHTDFSPSGLTHNQHIMGDYLNRVLTAGGGAWLNSLMAYYLGITDPRGLGAAYDTLLPYTNEADTLAAIQLTRQYLRNFQNRMEWLRPSLWEAKTDGMSRSHTQPLLLAYNGPNSQLGQLLTPSETDSLRKKVGFWFNGFSQFAHDSADGFTGFNYTSAGTSAGLDYAFSDNFVAGVGAGYAGTTLNLSGDWGHSTFNSYFATLYGTYFTDRAYVEGVVSYAKHQFHDRHFLDVGTGKPSATSSHDGDSLSWVLEGGYTFRPREFVIQPFTSLAYTYLDEGSFQESGAGALGLKINGRQSNSLASEVGARLTRPVKVSHGTLVPKVKAAWLHDFRIDKLSVPAAFIGSPNVGFAMDSRKLGENRAVLGAEIGFVSNNKGISASLRYDADLGNTFVSQSVSGQFRFAF